VDASEAVFDAVHNDVKNAENEVHKIAYSIHNSVVKAKKERKKRIRAQVFFLPSPSFTFLHLSSPTFIYLPSSTFIYLPSSSYLPSFIFLHLPSFIFLPFFIFLPSSSFLPSFSFLFPHLLSSSFVFLPSLQIY
jgi:hypothetical protein